jgi:hypothetical protein
MLHRPYAYALAALSLLAACGGDRTTVPPPPLPFAVTITSSATITGSRSVDGFGRPRVQCDYQIQARAVNGVVGDFALWTGGSSEWQFTGTSLGLEHPLSIADLVEWFGSDRITAARPLTTNRSASSGGPFTLAHTFRYGMPDGGTRSSTFLLTCV